MFAAEASRVGRTVVCEDADGSGHITIKSLISVRGIGSTDSDRTEQTYGFYGTISNMAISSVFRNLSAQPLMLYPYLPEYQTDMSPENHQIWFDNCLQPRTIPLN